MKFFFIILFSLFTTAFAGSINVATAANVSYAMHDLVKEFNRQYPDVKVQITLGSSGKLTAQIHNNAPYDIFMSANMKYPDALFKSSMAITKPVVYAKGELSLLSTRKRDFSKGIAVVKDTSIRRIAIANPQTAPYGKAAVEALKNAKLYQEIQHKLIYAESASQTLAYTVTAADLGFVAKSSLFSSQMKQYKKGINFIDVDPKLYTPIAQGIVLLKRAQNNTDAQAFYSFILSKKAQNIFKAYGYQI